MNLVDLEKCWKLNIVLRVCKHRLRYSRERTIQNKIFACTHPQISGHESHRSGCWSTGQPEHRQLYVPWESRRKIQLMSCRTQSRNRISHACSLPRRICCECRMRVAWGPRFFPFSTVAASDLHFQRGELLLRQKRLFVGATQDRELLLQSRNKNRYR